MMPCFWLQFGMKDEQSTWGHRDAYALAHVCGSGSGSGSQSGLASKKGGKLKWLSMPLSYIDMAGVTL